MPQGSYVVMDGDGSPVGTESFRCAPGPLGWRYVSEISTTDPAPHDERVDLVADADWSPVRTRVGTGAHELLLEAAGDRFEGWRDGEPVSLPQGPDGLLDYLTPATNVLATKRLSGTAEIEVVFLEPVTCVPRVERQRYELLGVEEVATSVGVFEATRWRFTQLSDAWTRDLWAAGDVIVRYEGLFELEAYEAGASGPRPHG